jgi:hypothetical protein
LARSSTTRCDFDNRLLRSGGAFQRLRDGARAALRKDAALEIERVARSHDARGPATLDGGHALPSSVQVTLNVLHHRAGSLHGPP